MCVIDIWIFFGLFKTLRDEVLKSWKRKKTFHNSVLNQRSSDWSLILPSDDIAPFILSLLAWLTKNALVLLLFAEQVDFEKGLEFIG